MTFGHPERRLIVGNLQWFHRSWTDSHSSPTLKRGPRTWHSGASQLTHPRISLAGGRWGDDTDHVDHVKRCQPGEVLLMLTPGGGEWDEAVGRNGSYPGTG